MNGPASDPDPGSRTGIRAWLDDGVVIVTIFMSLAITLFLAWRLVVHRELYPPTLIGAFLGITVAALIYRFLGGSQGNEFAIGTMKLVGSAAILGIFMVVGGDRLRTELRLYETRAEYDDASRGLEAAIAQLRQELAVRTRERDEASREALSLRRSADQGSRSALEAVRQIAPDDPIAGELRALAQAEQGPFQTLVRQLGARAVVNGSVPLRGTYNICADTFDRLYPSSPNTSLTVRRVTADGTTVEVRLNRKQEIDRTFCAQNPRPLDIQLSCDDGQELFPDLIAACDGRIPRFSREFGVQQVTLGAIAR